MNSGIAPPPLQLALIGETEIELRMREACPGAQLVSPFVGAPGSSTIPMSHI
jgi:hypothetical protein